LSDDTLIQGKGRVDPTPNWECIAIYFVDDNHSLYYDNHECCLCKHYHYPLFTEGILERENPTKVITERSGV
jgi:hypothetical protein